MKLAIIADIHGNLVAMEAVLADLQQEGPDLVVQGGDLVYLGPRPAECIDLIRELNWAGVIGNTDRAVGRQPFEAPHSRDRLAIWARERIGEERNAWLQALPMQWRDDDHVALVHAVPGDFDRTILPEADNRELMTIYQPLGARIAVYGHIHIGYVRTIGDLTVANAGSVGMPFDGDPRACYLLVTDGHAKTRRVAYDTERAIADLRACGFPETRAIAENYRTATLSRAT